MMGLEVAMNPTLRKILFWTPRGLGIYFVFFTSLFALDVFQPERPFLEIILALLPHLLPTFALALMLVLAWRWEWTGAVLFTGFAGWYLLSFPDFHWTSYAVLAGIPFILALLFGVGWVFRREIRVAPADSPPARSSGKKTPTRR
jgi:hypothetical protein